MEAMRIIGFSPEEVESIHRILAAILHLVSLAWKPGGRPLPLGTSTGEGLDLVGDIPTDSLSCLPPLLSLSRRCVVGSDTEWEPRLFNS